MSSFSSKVLIDLSSIVDGALPKTKEEITQDYLRRLYGNNLNTEFSFGDCFDGNLSGCSFDEERPPRYDDPDIIFGSVEPDKLIAFVKEMPDKVMSIAESILKQTPYYGKPLDHDLLVQFQKDGDYGLDTYRLRAAIDMLCDKPTFESYVLAYTDDGMFCSYPTPKMCASVEQHPEKWAVLPMNIRY